MIITSQTPNGPIIEEHQIMKNTIDKLKGNIDKGKKLKYAKELFDIIYFEFSFLDQISQILRGLSEGVSCKENILDNLITANSDLFEKKIKSFLKKITKSIKSHHSYKRDKAIQPEHQFDLLIPGGYSLKSIITNDDIISRIKRKQEGDSIARAEVQSVFHSKLPENRSSSMVNIGVPYKKNIIRPTSVTHKSKGNFNFIKQLSSTIESVCREDTGAFNEKKSMTSSKFSVQDNSRTALTSSPIEDKLLVKFHSILNSYNNESHQSTDTSKAEKKIIQTVIKRGGK